MRSVSGGGPSGRSACPRRTHLHHACSEPRPLCFSLPQGNEPDGPRLSDVQPGRRRHLPPGLLQARPPASNRSLFRNGQAQVCARRRNSAPVFRPAQRVRKFYRSSAPRVHSIRARATRPAPRLPDLNPSWRPMQTKHPETSRLWARFVSGNSTSRRSYEAHHRNAFARSRPGRHGLRPDLATEVRLRRLLQRRFLHNLLPQRLRRLLQVVQPGPGRNPPRAFFVPFFPAPPWRASVQSRIDEPYMLEGVAFSKPRQGKHDSIGHSSASKHPEKPHRHH